jgi:hypothetical protein
LGLLSGCGAQSPDEVAGEAVDTTQQSLGETACTTYPNPPVGTQDTNIANYNFTWGNCAQELYFSSSYNYNPAGCPRQYIFNVNDDVELIGTSHEYAVTPVYAGEILTSTTCPTAHLNMAVWRWRGYPNAAWLPEQQFTSTGSWEGGQCVFRRDDTGSSDRNRSGVVLSWAS